MGGVAGGGAGSGGEPGSTGQPRDGGARVSYALYERSSQTITWTKLPYDVKLTQRKILAAGLPPFNASRLNPGVPLEPLDPPEPTSRSRAVRIPRGTARSEPRRRTQAV